jgi:hypothetical protein
MTDPTYEKDKINANPVWELAWVLSELQNDNAPIGWGRYISDAECIVAHFKDRQYPFGKPAAKDTPR